MSTRGAAGYIEKGKITAYYNPCDSYPDGLGSDFLDILKSCVKSDNLNEFKESISHITTGERVNIFSKKEYPMLEFVYLFNFDDCSVVYLVLHIEDKASFTATNKKTLLTLDDIYIPKTISLAKCKDVKWNIRKILI